MPEPNERTALGVGSALWDLSVAFQRKKPAAIGADKENRTADSFVHADLHFQQFSR
jgi:hypothetical protein